MRDGEPDLALGAEFAGHVVEGVLGRGGMGDVYLAVREEDGRPVALKLLPAELSGQETYRLRFARESRLAASLSHPHLVRVLGSGEQDGTLWIAMELVEGEDLGSALAGGSAIHPAHAARIVAQVGDGLDAAAAAGLVHRDVKPGNVFVAARDGLPHAHLGDFGLTKATASESGLTAPGKFLGTIGYAAPEQIQGEQVSPATDVYALGALLYRALTGVLPFPRPRAVAVAMAHLNEPPPRPSESGPGCPPELDHVVATAMAKEAGERYASAGALGQAALAAAAPAGDPPPWQEYAI